MLQITTSHADTNSWPGDRDLFAVHLRKSPDLSLSKMGKAIAINPRNWFDTLFVLDSSGAHHLFKRKKLWKCRASYSFRVSQSSWLPKFRVTLLCQFSMSDFVRIPSIGALNRRLQLQQCCIIVSW